MQNSMLYPTDVLVHSHPVISAGLTPRAGSLLGRSEPDIVPGGTDKGVHGISLPAGRTTTGRTGGIHKFRALSQGRLPKGFKLHIRGQNYRQLFVRNGNLTALVAIDYRNGSAPVTLAGNQPIPQAEINPLQADIIGLHVVPDFPDSLLIVQAIELAGVHQVTFILIGPSHGLSVQGLPFRLNNHLDGQVILFSKLKVPLVMGRHTHYRPGTILHQNIVGNQDRHFSPVHRVDGIGPDKQAFFLSFSRGSGNFVQMQHLLDKVFGSSLIFRPFHQLQYQGMLRRQHHVAHPEDGVRAGGINSELFLKPFQAKVNLHPFTAPDPVLLHNFYLIRPAVQLFNII